MENILELYFKPFFHPFKFHREMNAKRKRGENTWNLSLNYSEVISVSWVFIIIRGFFAVIAAMIAEISYQYLMTRYDHLSELFGSYGIEQFNVLGSSFSPISLTIVSTVFGIVVFPFFSVFYIQLWRMIIKFCMELFNISKNNDEVIDQVIISSFSTNIILIVPIFGDFFRTIGFFVLMYAGFKENLGLNTKQSIFILLAPLVFVITVSVLFLVFFALMMMIVAERLSFFM